MVVKKTKKTTKSKTTIVESSQTLAEKKQAQPMSEEELAKQAEALPKELKESFDKIKPKLDKLTKKALAKFDAYIMGVAYLPPVKQSEDSKDANANSKEKGAAPNVLVLIDDSDSKKMTKFELKDKLSKIIAGMAQDIDKSLVTETLILSEVWQSCYDQKFDFLNVITAAVPVFDRGVFSAVKISEVHKRMVLKKFEKYIVSYSIAGGFTKGRIRPESDIDVYIVIDDTDVKKMTRVELKDKLRAIIISMGYDAKQMTGVHREFHIQVYILTDFWDSLKEAHPVIFDLLRDGVPLYDRGIFMPWKQLLKMGKIKPSEEAIDMFMNSGEQIQKRIKYKLREIAMEDIFLSIQTPSQAALMTYGLPPPAPKETPAVMEEVFVKKEGILEQKYVDILVEVIKMRKDIEHGKLKDIKGAKIDELLEKAEDYLKRINKLFVELAEKRTISSITELYDRAITLVRDVLVTSGIDAVTEKNMATVFKTEMVSTGKLPQFTLSIFERVIKAKKAFDSNRLSKNDIVKLKKDFNAFIKTIVEYIQRKRAHDMDRTKLRVKYGDTFGEVILLGKNAFVVHDLDADEKEVSKSTIAKDGSLGKPSKSSMEELEAEFAKNVIFEKIFVKTKLLSDIEKFFGKDVEILLN